MKKLWTVRCGYAARFADSFTVEAETLEEALEKAVETAHADRRPDFRCRRIFVDDVWEGVDSRDPDAEWPVPDRFTERGEPPLITLTDPGRAGGGAVEVSRGRVLLRFETPGATLTSELSDPPRPPRNKPLVTIRRRPDGAPDVTVTGGRARVRFLGYPA